jgi:hypothetical protein
MKRPPRPRGPVSRYAFCFLMVLSGCIQPKQPPMPEPPPRATGEIISAIAENADRLDRPLWSSSLSATARFRDEQGRTRVLNLDGTLLFAKPRSLRIDLRPTIGEPVMGIGSNEEGYWVWVEPELGEMRWGLHRNAGKPCAAQAVLRADQLVSAMGLCGLPASGGELLGPARRYGRQYDILSYFRHGPQGLLIDSEYSVDRHPPHLVRLLVLRDALGQVSMSAFLDDFRAAWEGGPLVPHALSVEWPKEGTSFTARMDRLVGIDPSKVKAGAFDRPGREQLPSGVREIVRIDADCDSEPAP